MLDKITGLKVLTRVAALGSLSAAARAMGMSQTMATKHLTALEDRLGARLVHRTTRRLALTEAGRDFLETVERLLDELEEAEAAVAEHTVEVRGTLRLNVPVSFGLRTLAPLVAELCRRHPGLAVDLALNDRHVDLIEEGWDLAVRIGNLRPSTLVARRLAPCPTALCAAPAYLARRGTPTRIAELASHDCLLYTLSRSIGVERWAFGREGRVSVPVRGSLRASNGDVLVAAAVAGLGIVYQPRFLLEDDLAAGRLVPLVLDRETLEIGGIYAVYPADRRPPAKVRAAIDFLAERLAGR